MGLRLGVKADDAAIMKHAIIIGAGIIGAASAYYLAKAGWRLTVIDSGDAGGLATRASFGWINASFHLDDDHFRLRHAGMAAHRALAAEVSGYHTWPGCLWFEDQGEEATEFAAKLTALGYAVRDMGASDVQRTWPRLTGVDRAIYLPDEGAVETPEFARALLRASRAEIWTGAQVTGFHSSAGQITGVLTDGGLLSADHVVLAAGNGCAPLLAQVGYTLPMLRRPGVMVITRPVVSLTETLLCGPMGEVRQLSDGRILIPTSPNHQGDETEHLGETPGHLATQALARLAHAFPGIEFHPETVMSANRPVPGDGRPVLGEVAPGLTLAVMHSGATLAAIAGRAVADFVTGREPNRLWKPYAPERYAK